MAREKPEISIRLLLNGSAIPVAQLGPDFLLVDAPTDHPPGNARLVLQVDRSERSWDVSLPNGMSAKSQRVVIAAKA